MSPHTPSEPARPEDVAARHVLEALPDGVWMFDDDGCTTYANDRMAGLLGVPPEQVVGYSVFSALDERGGRDFRAHLSERQRTGQAGHDVEVLLHRPDGSRIWALTSHSPVRDDDGRLLGWVYRVKDHTQQRALLAELEHRDVQFAEAQRIAGIGSWERDLRTEEAQWSAETYRICGVDPATFEPRADTFFELLDPEDLGAMESAYVRMLETGEPIDVESRLRERDGHATWLRVRGVVERDADGQPVRISGTVQDVTEARQRAQGLEFLSAIAGAANEARSLAEVLLAFERQVRPLARWPALLVALPGDEPHDGTGGSLRFVDLGYDGPPYSISLAQELSHRAVTERRTVHAAGPEGVVVVAGPVFVGPRLACVVASDTASRSTPDPSDLAIFEQMLVMLAHVAEREWAEEEIAEARDGALQASRAKSEFLTTMSHEIRTPLNGVIGLSELLRRTSLDLHQRRLASGIDEAGRTLLALVNDILDLSKIEAGRLDLEQVDFDPRRVLERSAALVADRAADKGLELVVSSAGDMPGLVLGDPVRFGQVVLNLAANAVKFTAEGEVEIRATTRRTDAGWRVRVEVRDTGVGIAPAAQARLFDPFTQADSSTTREFGGTGLGLTICRRIVDAMGGDIGVESSAGAGSTFWFEVDLGTSAVTYAPTDLEHENAVIGLRVLVVDDNATNRFILGEQLAAWGVEVSTEASAEAAGRALGLGLPEDPAEGTEDTAYDVVLLDYLMPDTDGLELARRIRSDERHELTRLVLASSAAQPGAEVLADAGVDAWLAKPVLPAALLEVLAGSCGGAPAPAGSTPRDRGTPGDERGRVLVVEDNQINQLVAEGVLRRLGYDVAIAENGAVGVAALADEPEGFAAVLMDCQMPVMDGFDATRAMRAVQDGGRRTPIIAMTAAAVADERTRCLEAGMDDFLAKPIDVGLLESTLTRWVGGVAPPPVPVLADRPDPGPGPADPPSWTRLSELVEDGIDAAEVTRWVERFRTRAPELLERLVGLAASGEVTEVSEVAHALRGSAANLGLVQLAGACEQIEVGARDGRAPASQLLADLRDAVRRADGELAAFVRTRLRT